MCIKGKKKMRYRHTDILAKKLLLYDNGLLGKTSKSFLNITKRLLK